MSSPRRASGSPTPVLDQDRLRRLFDVGSASWETFRELRGAHFHPFVPADYPGAYQALRLVAPHAQSFLEFGSGVGVITILADMLGLDAHGIEIDAWLVERATELAEEFQSDARFTCGSFIPEEFQTELAEHNDEFLTIAEGEPAYDELGQDVSDFDLVYAFPWPGDEELLFRMLARHARPDTMVLTYDGTEGYCLFRGGKQVSIDSPWRSPG